MRLIYILIFLFAISSNSIIFSNQMFTPLSIEESKIKMDEGLIIIDVRKQKEHDSLRIPGSHLINVKEISKEILESKFGENKDILIHCTAGVMSKVAAKKLIDQGYKGKFFEINEGMIGWVKGGMPTETN